VRLSSDDRMSSSTIEVDEVVSEYPSLNLVVEVDDGGFRGAVVTWLKADTLAAFVEQLRECERTRRGCAVLTSMSPDELELRIEQADELGHFAASYRLMTDQYTRRGTFQHSLSGGFDLDAEWLAQTVADFAELSDLCPRD
jgi:hypothetical protein